jgi:hypothetical protein
MLSFTFEPLKPYDVAICDVLETCACPIYGVETYDALPSYVETYVGIYAYLSDDVETYVETYVELYDDVGTYEEICV